MTQVKRAARIVAGFALLLAGAAMILLPGPGWVTIALGLALLSRDFPWAQRALQRLKDTAARVADTAREVLRRTRERFSGPS